jgi:hypothetical protein
MQVWRNCQVLSEQTSDSSAFLNVTWLLEYVLNCEQHFSFSIFWSGLSDTRINCNGISEGLLLYSSSLQTSTFICNECSHTYTSVWDGRPIHSPPAHVAKRSKRKANFSQKYTQLLATRSFRDLDVFCRRKRQRGAPPRKQITFWQKFGRNVTKF